eukprot:7022032-Heterocapsa_arctica.AAC.1
MVAVGFRHGPTGRTCPQEDVPLGMCSLLLQCRVAGAWPTRFAPWKCRAACPQEVVPLGRCRLIPSICLRQLS